MTRFRYKTKHKTINVNGDVIKMKIHPVTRMGNWLGGWTVRVNDKKYYLNASTWSEAFDKGYVKYIKENR